MVGGGTRGGERLPGLPGQRAAAVKLLAALPARGLALAADAHAAPAGAAIDTLHYDFCTARWPYRRADPLHTGSARTFDALTRATDSPPADRLRAESAVIGDIAHLAEPVAAIVAGRAVSMPGSAAFWQPRLLPTMALQRAVPGNEVELVGVDGLLLGTPGSALSARESSRKAAL